MRTKRDTMIGIANISIDSVCIMIGVYMVHELYCDILDFMKRG